MLSEPGRLIVSAVPGEHGGGQAPRALCPSSIRAVPGSALPATGSFHVPPDAAALSWSGVKAAISCSSPPINNSWSPIKPTGEMVCYWKTMRHH